MKRRHKPHPPSTKMLDALCRLVVLARDGHRCRRCGATNRLQWCHIYSRRYQSLRWHTLNSMMLCAGCHLWQHHNPIEGGRFFESELGREWDKLQLIRRTPRKVDREAERLALLAELNGQAGDKC